MKQFKIIRAYKSLSRLYEQKLPLTVSHKLWMLKQKLDPTWEFQNEKEQEVIMKYEPQVSENGQVTFKSDDEAMRCKEEYIAVCKELADIDVDLDDFQKISIALDDKLELSIEDLEALSDFIDFTE